MSLVPCRACGHQVDTSAFACPECGASDPGQKISRQQRDLRLWIMQTVVWVFLLCGFGLSVWTYAVPWAKRIVNKQSADLPALSSPAGPQ